MTRTIVSSGIITTLLVALLSPAALAQQAPAGETIERYKSSQDRARQLTSELLSALLDQHIQQLEDNRLTELPLYKDLVDMRSRMGALAEQMMPEVIETLVLAGQTTGDTRATHLQTARARMKVILVRLLTERERLRIRRQQAELIERLREMIEKQKATRTATLALGADERAILRVIDAQDNIKTLFESFEKMLNDVATWPGELGAISAEAARIMVENKFNCLPVLGQEGDLVGITTSSDLLSALVHDADPVAAELEAS